MEKHTGIVVQTATTEKFYQAGYFDAFKGKSSRKELLFSNIGGEPNEAQTRCFVAYTAGFASGEKARSNMEGKFKVAASKLVPEPAL